jgi:hypothetical protein
MPRSFHPSVIRYVEPACRISSARCLALTGTAWLRLRILPVLWTANASRRRCSVRVRTVATPTVVGRKSFSLSSKTGHVTSHDGGNLGAKNRRVVSTMPLTLFPSWKNRGTHCIKQGVTPRTGLDGCGRFRPPPGYELRTVQSAARRPTDWAIMAALSMILSGLSLGRFNHKALLFQLPRISVFSSQAKRTSTPDCLAGLLRTTVRISCSALQHLVESQQCPISSYAFRWWLFH